MNVGNIIYINQSILFKQFRKLETNLCACLCPTLQSEYAQSINRC